MEGWIKIHRKITGSDGYFSEPFCRNMAWIDLILLANYSDSSFFVRSIKIEVKRGSLAYGSDTLAKRWRWSRGKVLRFLNALESDAKIVQQKSKLINVISISNYDKYQLEGTTNGTTDSTTDGTHKKKDKKDKNIVSTNVETLTHPLQIYIRDNYPNISKLKNQLTEAQASRLISRLDKKLIKIILDDMENNAVLTKKYTSVNLTIQSWVRWRKSKQIQANEPKPLQKVSAEDPYAAFAG